jgi:DNA-binding MarR family transcriptional regulator
VLATLRRSGELYMLSPTHLYETVMISSGGMTNRLDRLERAGLVERRPDPNDRRGKLIALTDAGKHVIDQTIDRHVANEERILSVLTPAEQKAQRAA